VGNKIGIIGSGFSSLSAAAVLAKAGHEVHIFEKNETVGGRARQFKESGFTFDMGPSWYWMPEVFENFYRLFNKTSQDFYQLERLNPSYKVYFGKDDFISMPSNFEELENLFESIEPGSKKNLKKFLEDAKYKYEVGMQEFVWKPSVSIFEFFDFRILKSFFKLQMFSSISKQIDGLFKSEKIRNILKFPVLFLGATPEKTPALYSLMNYADIKLGTWYPQGGMFKIVEAFKTICDEQGVQFHLNEAVEKINFTGNMVNGFKTTKHTYNFDFVISGGDYHHVEQTLIPLENRIYSQTYWDTRTMAPSSLLFYIGLDTQIDELEHHNLFFDKDFAKHADEIYTNPSWPSDPLFYVSRPSKTDSTIAPEKYDNLFILMPLAPGLNDSDKLREEYFNLICDRIYYVINVDIRDNIIYKKSYCIDDFIQDYNSFKGNAYGLANTLLQTAFLKPKIKHTKLKNLYFTGQLTNPGPGVPPAIISGQVIAQEILSTINR